VTAVPKWWPFHPLKARKKVPGQFVGPLGDLANGVDIGLPLSLAIAALLHLALLRLFPEPRAAYGPEGAPARPDRGGAGSADHRAGRGS
jgi:hypothetical protein